MANERNGINAVQAFRSKYPGAYDRYSDSELMDAIKKKYPGKYEDLAVEPSIPKQESVLQRAIKAISPQQVGYEMMGGTAPSDIGMGLGRMATGGSFQEGMNPMARAEAVRKEGVGDNI